MKLPDLTTSISRSIYWIAAAILAATFILRPDGYGVSLCAFKNATDLDCFGCGMTRGVTSLTHLRPGHAWRYHPFAFLFWPLMIGLALGVIPPIGARMEQLARTHRRGLNAVLWTATALFLLFGVVRMFRPAFWY